MTFREALTTLGIEQYETRIFNSNSHGELFHIQQYFILANEIGKTDWFPELFEHIVRDAEKNWTRPESVFQHIVEIISKKVNA